MACLLAFKNAYAGKLDDFESSAEQRTDSGESNSSKHNSRDQSSSSLCDEQSLDLGCLLADMVIDVVSHMLVYGGGGSFERVNGAASALQDGENYVYSGAAQQRELGEPLIPFVRLDLGYQRNSSDIHAYDYRLEAGYAAAAFNVGKTRYTEKKPRDSLEISRMYGAYRMSFGPFVEIDWGIGTLKLKGNGRQSFLFLTTPILIRTSKTMGFEFRPAWAGSIREYDFAGLYSIPFMSVKLGYRQIKTETQSLNGPYLGIAAHY